MAEKLNGPGFGARMAVTPQTNDGFRALLSYCESEAEKYPEDVILNPGDAYRDVAGKLRGMLDGE